MYLKGMVSGASVARVFISLGIFFLSLGGVFFLLGRVGLGKLPGDFVWEKGMFRGIFPLGSALLLSLLLTPVLNFLLFLFRR